MPDHDQKLFDVLEHLSGEWSIDDYQIAGMGWVAVIMNDANIFTLHSERGWVDIYKGMFTEKNVLACKQRPDEIAGVIEDHCS